MKIQREVKVGVVVVAAIGFLIYGVNYLKGIDLFKKGREFYAVYDNINGLVAASPVQFNGLKVGQVTNTQLVKMKDRKKRMLVTFIIDNKDFEFPRNSMAKLASADLFGTRAIVIQPGDGSEIALEGDTLMTEEEKSLQAKVDAQIAPIKKKAEDLMGSLDTILIAVNSLLGENRDELTSSIENVKYSLSNLRKITDRINGLMESESARISSILTKVDNVAGNLARNTESIDKTLDNMAILSDSLAKADIVGTMEKAKVSIDNLSQILTKVSEGEGTLGQLVTSDSLYNSLVHTNDELSKLIENINAHPNRYLHISVFGRKEKGLKLDSREEKKLKEILK